MKRARTLVAALALALTATVAAGCSDKESDKPDTPPADTTSGATTPASLEGTVWHANPRYTYTDANGSYPCDISYDLTFSTATAGDLYLEVLVDGRTFIPQHTFDMTYEYDGHGSGTLHIADGDPEFVVEGDRLHFDFYLDLHNNADGNDCTVGGRADFTRIQ